jgi:hypothetical protein
VPSVGGCRPKDCDPGLLDVVRLEEKFHDAVRSEVPVLNTVLIGRPDDAVDSPDRQNDRGPGAAI